MRREVRADLRAAHDELGQARAAGAEARRIAAEALARHLQPFAAYCEGKQLDLLRAGTEEVGRFLAWRATTAWRHLEAPDLISRLTVERDAIDAALAFMALRAPGHHPVIDDLIAGAGALAAARSLPDIPVVADGPAQPGLGEAHATAS